MTKTTYINSIEPSLALAISNLIVKWSGMGEPLLGGIAGELMVGKPLLEGDDMVHTMAITGMDARVLIGLVKSLIRLRLPKIEEPVISLIETVEKTKEMRDLVAHCRWRKNAKGQQCAWQLKSIGKVKSTMRVVTATDINASIKALEDATVGLLRHMQGAGYMKRYKPLPEKSE